VAVDSWGQSACKSEEYNRSEIGFQSLNNLFLRFIFEVLKPEYQSRQDIGEKEYFKRCYQDILNLPVIILPAILSWVHVCAIKKALTS
jgi:hypothetical protein